MVGFDLQRIYGAILFELDSSSEVYDIVVVGAGPNGLYAAHKIKKELPWMHLLVVEKIDICANINQYPNVRWHSKMKELKLPSQINHYISDEYEPISSELVSYYNTFSKEHSISVLTGSRVINVKEKFNAEKQRLLALQIESATEGSTELLARNVILATGIYSNPRTLDIIGSEKLQPYYELGLQNLDLMLIGGGNSAADFIIYLLPYNRITWVLRGESWRSVFANLSAKFESIMAEFKGNLTLITNSEVVSIGTDSLVKLSNHSEVGPFDHFFCLIGFNSLSPLVRAMELDTEFDCLVLSDSFETSLDSVFAFGSIMSKWDKTNRRANPTFIHNGNEKYLEKIIEELRLRYTEEIFSKNVNPAIFNKSRREINSKGLKKVVKSQWFRYKHE